MAKLHIFLGRMHPVHNGHKAIFKEMKLNMTDSMDGAMVIIGSSNRVHEQRNPLPIDLRLKLVNSVVRDVFYKDEISVISLEDLTNENDNSIEWGDYVMDVISKNTSTLNFNSIVIHYSDEPEIIGKWFDRKKHPKLELFIHNRWNMQDTSATKVREMILKGDDDVFNHIPQEIHKNIFEIKKHLDITNQN